jgi:UDP-GlcNAc:undecaprenyl-phosphate GlcNAc-1-phosphate transferase
MLMAILRRKLTGKSIGQADRGHIHHHLQDRGLTRVQCLLTLGALCVVMATIALVAAYTQRDILAVGLCASVLAVLTAGRIFGHDEANLLFRHIGAINMLVADSLRALPSRILAARMPIVNGGDQEDVWEKLCQRVARMGGTNVEFRCINGNEERPVFAQNWCNGENGEQLADSWQFQYSIRRNDHLRMTIVAEGHVNDRLRAQRLDDLFRLFDTFCRHWPIERSSSPLAAPDKLPPDREVPPDLLFLDDYIREAPQLMEERRAA